MGSGGLYFAIGHVNLIVGRKYHDIRSPIDDNVYLTIDFLPLGDTRGQHSWSIAENTVIAMYMNNRAAEALARQALRREPENAQVMSNLVAVLTDQVALPKRKYCRPSWSRRFASSP